MGNTKITSDVKKRNHLAIIRCIDIVDKANPVKRSIIILTRQ